MSPQAEAKLLELLTEAVHGLRNFTDTAQLHADVLRFSATLAQHGERLTRAEQNIETADQEYVEDLKKKLVAQEGSAQHWVRYVIAFVGSVLLVVISAAVGAALKK